MNRALFLSVLIFLSACSPAAKMPSVSHEEALHEIRLQKQIAVREQMAQLSRLYDVGYPIMAANAPLCGKKVWPHHGMMLESLSNIGDNFKDAMRIFYGVENQLTAAHIVKGSPADGKIFPGDRIMRVNGVPIPSGSKGEKVFLKTIWKPGRDVTLPVTLGVRRGRTNNIRDVVIHPVAGCASYLALEDDDAVNAHANGTAIVFSTGMMRFADNDNMLAMVFAHELTHNAREHIEAKLINRFLGSMIAVIVESGTGVDFSNLLEDVGLKAFSQSFENEADYVGLYMYARAGFPVEDGIDLHRRMAAIHPGAIHIDPESSHPSSAGRFIALRKAAAEIAAKRAANRPLLPEEKTGADILKDLDKID
jgi:hypothetical protein